MKHQYYQKKNKQFYTEHTKQELINIIDPYNINTFLPVLKVLDYPYIKKYWEKITTTYKGKNILGRYLARMNLLSYRDYTWKDSDWLNKYC